MNTRPAWGALFVGALVVAALLLSPLWLVQFEDYFRREEEGELFPPAFYVLSPEQQELYEALLAIDEQMAIDFVGARLAEPVEVVDENLPATDPNPVAVIEALRGNFVTVDPVRSATGIASIYRLSNGRWLLRLQNLDAYGGPQVHVLLSAVQTPNTPEALAQGARLQIDLGALKGNRGSQNYFIEDPTFNVDNYLRGSVVLYSVQYDVVMSYAPLAVTDQYTSGQ